MGLFVHDEMAVQEVLMQSAQLMPADWERRRRFGQTLARRRMWAEAAALYTAAAQVEADIPEDDEQLSSGWEEGATVLFQSGDLDGYRRYCRAMLDRFENTPTPFVAERVAKACLFVPPDESLRDAALAMADRSVTLDPTHWVIPWAQMGLAEYRRGHDAQAVEWCEKCLAEDTSPWYRTVQATLVQAMANVRLDRRERAREALEKAAELLAAHEDDGRGEFANWIFCQALLAEATSVVESARQSGL